MEMYGNEVFYICLHSFKVEKALPVLFKEGKDVASETSLTSSKPRVREPDRIPRGVYRKLSFAASAYAPASECLTSVGIYYAQPRCAFEASMAPPPRALVLERALRSLGGNQDDFSYFLL